MNIKKMFASLAGMLIVATTTLPLGALGAPTHSEELQGAYAYAYDKEITTMSSIDNANMYGELTRAQLAKMIANWAEKEQNRAIDTTIACIFPDADKAEGDLAFYIKKACQMGLMGQGIASFRPNDKVTRGEFGTTLSRAIYGDKYNTSEVPFYKNHLVALRDAGIMSKIETPNQMEIRGWVMLMLQRAATGVTNKKVCEDPVVAMACLMNGPTCPAICKDNANNNTDFNNVRDGDLNVAVSRTNNIVSIPNKAVVKVGEVKFNATKPVMLFSMDVTRIGLSMNQGLKVFLEKDGKRVSSRSSFFGNSTATVTLNGDGYKVLANDTLDVVIELDAATGNEIAFKIAKVESSASNVNIAPDTTTTFRTANYEVTNVSVASVPTNGEIRSYNQKDGNEFIFGTVKLTNNSPAREERDVKVQSVALKITESDIDNLKNFRVFKDGKLLESAKVEVDNKFAVLVLNDILPSGKSASYALKASPINFERADGDKYVVHFNKTTDLVAQEVAANLEGNIAWRVSVAGHDIKLGEYTVKGGKITLSRDKGLASTVYAGSGYSDVVIAKGTLNAAQKVHISAITLTGATGTDPIEDIVRRATLKVGGRSYQATSISNSTGIVFDSDFYFNQGTNAVELTIDVKNNASWSVLKLNPLSRHSFSSHDAYYLNTDETTFKQADIAGSMKISDVKVQEQRFGLYRKMSKTDVKIVEKDTDQVTIFEGELKNSGSDDIEVTSLKFMEPALVGITAGDVFDANIYLDGSDNAAENTTVRNGTGETLVNGLGLTLEPGKTKKIKITAMVNPDLAIANSFRYKIQLSGLSRGNTVTSSKVDTAKVTITASAQSSFVASSDIKSSFLKVGEEVAIASFNVNVRNGEEEVKDLTFNTTGLTPDMLGGVRVAVTKGSNTKNIDMDGYIVNPNELKVTFNNSLTLEPGTHRFTLFADLSDETLSFSPALTQFTLTDVKFDVGGANITTTPTTLALIHNFGRAYPILEKKNGKLDGVNSRFDLVIKNPSEHSIKITNIALWGIAPTSVVPAISVATPLVIGGGNSYTVLVKGQDVSVTSINFDIEADETIPYTAITHDNMVEGKDNNWNSLAI